MRSSFLLASGLAVLVACASNPPPAPEPIPSSSAERRDPAPAGLEAAEVVAADTPKTTFAGNKFIAPAGWSITVRGAATILEPPEKGSCIAIVDVQAKDADEALALAWSEYDATKKRPLKVM